MKREWPSTSENRHMIRMAPGSSVNSVTKRSEVDLGLLAGRRLEPHLERLRAVVGPDRGHEPLHRRVGTAVAALADLTRQTHRALRSGNAATRWRR